MNNLIGNDIFSENLFKLNERPFEKYGLYAINTSSN